MNLYYKKMSVSHHGFYCVFKSGSNVAPLCSIKRALVFGFRSVFSLSAWFTKGCTLQFIFSQSTERGNGISFHQTRNPPRHSCVQLFILHGLVFSGPAIPNKGPEFLLFDLSLWIGRVTDASSRERSDLEQAAPLLVQLCVCECIQSFLCI